jgi:hypothetical protein
LTFLNCKISDNYTNIFYRLAGLGSEPGIF